MSSVAERSRNNVRAGVFVSIAILLAVGTVVVLTDALAPLVQRTIRYTVTFEVRSGVNNLKRGSEVRVGGVPMGYVTAVRPRLESGQAFRVIDVDFRLDHAVPIFADAQVMVANPLLGAEAWLEIPNVGDPGNPLPESRRLQGVSSVGVLTTLLGAENAGRANEIVANAHEFTGFLATLPDEFQQRLVPTLDDVRITSGNLRDVSDDVRGLWAAWGPDVDEVISRAAQIARTIEAASVQARDLINDSREVVAENRSSIKASTDNLQELSSNLNLAFPQLQALMETGQLGLDQAVKAVEELRVDYQSWSTRIDDSLANMSLATQQLKLALIEIRRSPWRIAFRPPPQELQHELLYEAARSFAVGAADLKSASEAVRRVLENHRDELGASEEAYRRLEQSLLNSLANYEKAQQQLLDVLFTDGRGAPKK